MNKLRYALALCATGAALCAGVVPANAETHITAGYLNIDTHWTVEESPFIIDTFIAVTPGHTLTIDPGVTVTADPVRLGYKPGISIDRGSLVMLGTLEKPITVSGILGINIMSGRASLRYADLSTGEGLSILDSTAVISSSTLRDGIYGLYARTSTTTITGSLITGNHQGLFIEKAPLPVYQVRGVDESQGMGGIGNALADETASPDESRHSSITITDSSISGNEFSAINNLENTPVRAAGNWWGSSDDPSATTTNTIRGAVEFAPWLTADPLHAKIACCSSILFIPGIMGTRLMHPASWPLLGSSTDMLWEPLSNRDVQSLYQDPSGKSIDRSVYAGDPIDAAFGRVGVYGALMSYLDGLKNKGTISGWKPFGYDWRTSVEELASSPQKKATTTESLVALATALAQDSKTGKVTVIAHSNGGLVATYLVKALGDAGKVNLVDQVISVAVPFLGTPQALLGLLHGSGQSIADGLILKESVARGLGINMPSAYGLIPSKAYFTNIFGPTVAFASSTIAGMNNGSYPRSISTFTGQDSFVRNTTRGRVSAQSSDTSLAAQGNSLLASAQSAIQDFIASFAWPSSIARWSIVGWDKPTASGVMYSEKTSCFKAFLGMSCSPRPVHDMIPTLSGDGTVISQSAAYGSGNIIGLDLKDISRREGENIGHSNILESSTTLATLDSIITNKPMATETLRGVSYGSIPSGAGNVLEISTHSPVSLHVYDPAGAHSGSIDASSSSPFLKYENSIPGSTVSMTDAGDTSVIVPDDGTQYSVSIDGAGVGEFTLDIERKQGMTVLDSVEFAGIPVLPLTSASTTITSGGSMLLASSTAALKVDVDGNGTIDLIPQANVPSDPVRYFETFKKMLPTFCSDVSRLRRLEGRFDYLIAALKRGKMIRVRSSSVSDGVRVGHMRFKKITPTDRADITNGMDDLISQFE